MNITKQYAPALIGVATTCLAETIGENVGLHLRGLDRENATLPPVVHVATPAFAGSPMAGYRRTVRAIVERFARPGTAAECVALMPPMVSTADLRHLREIVTSFGLGCIMVPDYSDTLDGGIWETCRPLPAGGTTLEELGQLGTCAASIEIGVSVETASAAALLQETCGVPAMRCGLPLGIDACDAFFGMLAAIAEHDIPPQHAAERRRLVDAYVDGHKFTAGRRVLVWGDEDFAPAIAAFAAETGLQVVAVAAAVPELILREAMDRHSASLRNVMVIGNADFEAISAAAVRLEPDLLIGNGKGYQCARKLGIPFVRTGFPVHDRFGAQRLLHVGYEGTLSLYDRIVNTIIERRQDDSDAGYLCW